MLQALPDDVTPGPAGPDLAAADVARGHRALRQRRRRRLAGVAGTVAVGAAAVVLVATSAPRPTATAASGKPSATAAPAAANPVLAQLAANITVRQVKLSGNATLEIRNQSPARATVGGNGIDLYTDDGTYYWGYSKSNLQQAIAQGQDVGQGEFKRAIAAALIADKGDVATARAQMAVANLIPGAKPDPSAKQAMREKLKADKAKGITPPKPLTPQQQQELTDSYIWMNSVDALIAAPENPQVRAGVLDIMATMPNVKVTHTTTAGQPTLTLDESTPLLPGGGGESLVINASTGLPVAESDTTSGVPSVTTYYHVFRVTLAGIEAGKF
jgi:hypothetical protein